MRILVIGDIHGGLLALQQILEKASVTTKDTLIFLGDYVDGWSESPLVLDFLILLKKTHNCIFLRGNHDDILFDWLTGNDKNFDKKAWLIHGGESTVISYKTISKEKRLKHIEFLKSLRDYYIDSKNRLFVHAGFTNTKGVKHEYFPKLLYWDRTLWEMVLAMDQSIQMTDKYYPKRLSLYDEVYIGHTPVTQIGETIPVKKATVWNIDTGAAFLGSLTIMDIDTKEFWQSDSLPSLYPNEKGRN